jgi:hypothetical protein
VDFGYKLHLTCTTGKIIVPLTADVTTANVSDNKMYAPLTSSSVFSSPSVLYVIAESGYDDKKLYVHSKKVLRVDLVCPLNDTKILPKRGLNLCFYESEMGWATIYNQRRISIEQS